MLTNSRLIGIEGKTSEALKNNKNDHEDFMAIFNEERNYEELREIIRLMISL